MNPHNNWFIVFFYIRGRIQVLMFPLQWVLEFKLTILEVVMVPVINY
jgi:hypothetical protein